ncbi:MAG: tellurite resistance TerB family protein [Steroidobacteraceae bacterium]
MLDPKLLLDQILGGGASGGGQGGFGGGLRNAGQQFKNRLDQTSGSGAFAGGAAVGGLLGMLLGGKGMRKAAGGVLGYGGAAAIGALALRAYQNYQEGKAAQGATPMSPSQLAEIPQAALPHAKPATDGSAFELVLIRAMVGAAKADGHIDADEQRRLFSEVERMGLDAESKAYVFDLLTKPVDLEGVARCVASQEQGAELYLAARLAIDPNEPSERAYLDALASRLELPADLRTHLDAQATSG